MYFFAGRLHRLEQLVGVLQRAQHRRHRAGDVLAVLHHVDAMPGVACRVGRDEHRLDRVVLDHLLERRIGLLAAAVLGQRLAAIGKQIAHRGHGDVGMILETERRAELAATEANDADADFAIGNGLPFSLSCNSPTCSCSKPCIFFSAALVSPANKPPAATVPKAPSPRLPKKWRTLDGLLFHNSFLAVGESFVFWRGLKGIWGIVTIPRRDETQDSMSPGPDQLSPVRWRSNGLWRLSPVTQQRRRWQVAPKEQSFAQPRGNALVVVHKCRESGWPNSAKSTPKALHIIAQGCRAAATLGVWNVIASKPQRGFVEPRHTTKPRWGLRRDSIPEPWVAAAPQPRAMLRNRFAVRAMAAADLCITTRALPWAG